MPTEVRAGLSAEEKDALANDPNDHRRHLTPDEQQDRASRRRNREQISLRAVAISIGISLDDEVPH